MEGPKPSLGIDDVFRGHLRKERGNKREVYEVQGVEGLDFFVKTSQSDEELEVLRFLSETGISERLLMYDEEKMILEKIDGDYSQDYLGELIKQSPDMYTVSESADKQNTTKFKIKSLTATYVPERAVVDNEKIKTFVVDYSSKLLFLVLTGVVHKDIKIDNILADKAGKVRFIDFGETMLVGDTKKEVGVIVDEAINDLSKGIELLSMLNPVYAQKSQEIKRNEFIKHFFSEIYTSYQQQSVPLSNRPLNIKELSESGKLKDLISQIGMPEEIQPDIENSLLALGPSSHSQ